VPTDAESWSEAVLGDEDALVRAITFSNIPVVLSNLFVEKRRLSIIDFIHDTDPIYRVRRTKGWAPRKTDHQERRKEPFCDDAEPPEVPFYLERMKHSDMKVISPIDAHKWNAANWIATLFMFAPGDVEYPPVLGLAYQKREPARAIFEGLRSRFGPCDRKNDLRIAIVRRISKSDPLAYAVIVGPNLGNVPKTPGDMFTFVSRFNRMYPLTHQYLEGFLHEFRRHGRFLLVPAYLPTLQSEPQPMIDLGLGKYDVVVREAWEIGENEPDASVLDLDDPPIIPTDQPNAPVLKALVKLGALRQRRI
jgi:hypothetical protein